MGIEQAKNSLMGGGKNSFSPLDRSGGKNKISKETRKKVQAAKKAGRKEGDKRWGAEARKHMKDNKTVMAQAATPAEVAKSERSMMRANKKYAKQLTKQQGGDVKAAAKAARKANKAAKKTGVGKAYGKGSVNDRRNKESKRVWDNQRSAKKAAKKNPSKANLSKLKEAQAQRRQDSKRRAESSRRANPFNT